MLRAATMVRRGQRCCQGQETVLQGTCDSAAKDGQGYYEKQVRWRCITHLGRHRLAPDTARVALEHCLGHRCIILGHRCVLDRVALEPQLGRCLASGPASASSTTGDGPPHARPCGDSRPEYAVPLGRVAADGRHAFTALRARLRPGSPDPRWLWPCMTSSTPRKRDMDACSPPPTSSSRKGFSTSGRYSRARGAVGGSRFRQRTPHRRRQVAGGPPPTGFVDSAHPDHVCLLSRSLYGLKQAPRAWYQRITTFLHQLSFRSTRSDASLFVYTNNVTTAYLLLYVDDIILTASSTDLCAHRRLRVEFALKDLGPLHYFLGIEVVRRTDGFFLHQRKYAHELLDRAGMLNCKPVATPVDTKSKLSATDGSFATNASSYRSIVGALQYLTLTRPELQYVVQHVCLHMHAPRDPHWAAVKRILRYIRGTMDFGLSLHASTATDIVAYSDADWAGCPDTRRSTAEAEYRAVANAVAEVSWLRQLLVEFSCPVAKATVVYCDNVSAVYLSANPVHHRRTKHIELDIHFVREQVALNTFEYFMCPPPNNLRIS
ncbi:hypothetical protein QYE76_068172 [Lolium multiflorum]|uniref:Reverse transcriptase Ty1/copia-type domain-containing protein n=1 Tax=Lolium multiflorum TaxID=4521 RepID=A0AAD8SFS3_LOLMU|nr:hypothetical protein QYE76_068172 [Lolium multiflorum]